MHYVVLNNDLTAWAMAIGIVVAVCACQYLVRRLVVRRLQAFAQPVETCLDELAVAILRAIHPLFMLAMGAYGSSLWLVLTDKAATFANAEAPAAANA